MAANIQSLTALRGLAALTVLIYHCAGRAFGDIALVPPPLGHGYLAVDLFFLLSGFVLMHVHEQDFSDGVAWTSFKSFLRARFARTYPIHVVILLLLLPRYGNPDYSGVAFVHSLFLAQAPWLSASSWNVPAWSISAEWHAYLLFPFLVMPWRRRSRRATMVILALCLVTLSLAIIASGNRADITHTPLVLLRCLPAFIAGMGLHRIYRQGWLPKWMAGDRAVVISAIAIVVLASFRGTDIAVIVALTALLLVCAHNHGAAARILTTGVPLYLGRISYSLYMVQLVSADAAAIAVKYWLAPHANGGVIVASAMLVLSFALAIPLSRYIEYPMRDWLRGRVRAAA